MCVFKACRQLQKRMTSKLIQRYLSFRIKNYNVDATLNHKFSNIVYHDEEEDRGA